jgi:putative peptidoglycan lipid II flippase
MGAIPMLTGVSQRESARTLSTACSELITATIVAATLLCMVGTGIMLLILPALAGGSPHLLVLTRQYMIELSPYAVSGAVLGALTAILAVKGMFAIPALMLGSEAVLKVALVLLFPQLGAQALVIGSLAGNLLAVLVLWELVRRRGIELRLAGFWASPMVRGVIKLTGPLLVAHTVLQFNPLIDRATAAALGAGNVTAVEFGARLYGAATTLLATTLVAPLATTWSARLATDGWAPVWRSFSRVVVAVVLLVPPLAIAGFLVRRDLIALIYQSHAYSGVAVSRTADVFGLLLLGLAAEILIVPLATLFVIRGDSVFPMKIALANVVLNTVLDLALRGPYGVGGIAASTALTYTILCAAYFMEAHRRWGSIDLRIVCRPMAVSSASCISIVASYVALVGLGHFGHSRGQELAVAVLVFAIATAIHAVSLVFGRVAGSGTFRGDLSRSPLTLLRR